MIITDPSTVNFKSYKRLFVFGCSFTNYMWPTWADLLRAEMPDAEFFNLGKSGAGALFISSMVVEANQRYNFNEHDLIIVQWSTYFREDRYVKNFWTTPGNIFTQQVYDDDFVRKFACIRGYIIRDLALMTSTKIILDALPCSSLILSSIPINAEIQLIDPETKIDDALELYRSTIDSLQSPMSEVLRPPGNETIFPWSALIEYIDDNNGNKRVTDYHPTPASYYTYIEKLGFTLTEKSLNAANEAEQLIRTFKFRTDFETYSGYGAPTSTIL